MMTLRQGWEFALRFFERIARFLWAKEQFAREKERIAPIAHNFFFVGAIGAICSQSLFLKNNESDSLFKMSDFARKSEERKSEFPTLLPAARINRDGIKNTLKISQGEHKVFMTGKCPRVSQSSWQRDYFYAKTMTAPTSIAYAWTVWKYQFPRILLELTI